MKITIGADPEVFLVDKTNKETYIPVTGLIGGDKWAPFAVDGGALQEDNVMAEFNIQPATNSKQFIGNVNKVFDQLKALMDKYGLETKIISHAKFDKKLLYGNEAAKVFGCDPDECIYTMEQNVVDTTALVVSGGRVAGGHIHIGIINKDKEFALDRDPMARAYMVQAADLFIGLPSTLLETDLIRKKFYGKAGAYRPKEYGIEYRTPSNFWLQSQEHMVWIFEAAKCAANTAIDSKTMITEFIGFIGQNNLQNIINTQDRESAKRVCKELGIKLPPQSLWLSEAA